MCRCYNLMLGLFPGFKKDEKIHFIDSLLSQGLLFKQSFWHTGGCHSHSSLRVGFICGGGLHLIPNIPV